MNIADYGIGGDIEVSQSGLMATITTGVSDGAGLMFDECIFTPSGEFYEIRAVGLTVDGIRAVSL